LYTLGSWRSDSIWICRQIPWSPDLKSWFDLHYETVHGQRGVFIFRKQAATGHILTR